MIPIFRALAPPALALLLLAHPGGVDAQAPDAQPALPDSIQQLLGEFGALRERFESAQTRALGADEGLREEQVRVRDLVTATALRLRPHMEELLIILPQIHEMAIAADRAGDVERLEALVADGRRIQGELEDAQSAAIAEPEVAREIEAFEAKMVSGMRKVDPEIDQVLERIQAIAARLEAWVGRPSR